MKPDQAVDYLKIIVPDYDLDNGRHHIVKPDNHSNPNKIEILFVFGANITAYYNYQMKAFYKLKARNGEDFLFYWKFEKWAEYIDLELERASTCSVCGAKKGYFSDGYFFSPECKNGDPNYYNGCEVLETNDFSKFIETHSR